MELPKEGFIFFNPKMPEGEQFLGDQWPKRACGAPTVYKKMYHLKNAVLNEVTTDKTRYCMKTGGFVRLPPKTITLCGNLKGWYVGDLSTGRTFNHYIRQTLVERVIQTKTLWYPDYDILDLWDDWENQPRETSSWTYPLT